ncbi:SNF family Na+-dependent transporter [Belliella baltica DSM 15883]|uniref:Transporter n=1 Tax=Belliella baltica (strain DSM 15883 / CIP 108006 / LMG 21964 / BA134) TaxID=866536 RepID=I3Z163_BELBD|nr:sodium-dependent transporter [Belliella baltica]AFL82981.1 SNF family Na+-dependent transporter [Belliella baltica DSM 15883]
MAVKPDTESRGQWGSSLGFIMAAAGSAVGLGNIWRFPYITGENGGGAFVFVYILCVILIGIPLLFNELAIGRLTGKNPIGAMKIASKNKLWMIPGIMSVVICFMVLTYYSVIAGWTVGYIITELINIPVDFEVFIRTPEYIIPLTFFFMVITILVILGGVSGGIEKASKLLMPVLFILIILIAGRSVTLEGASEGIKYYLQPDFSKIDGGVILAALGQAFFSMSVGWGLMVTYGSYLPKSSNLVSSGLWIGAIDSFVALLGGLMIFPAVFALGLKPDEGPSLVFKILPEVFNQIPGGSIVGAAFFLLLMVAALTSTISMLEVPVGYLIDEKKVSRKKAAWGVGIAAMLISIPAILSSIDGNVFNTVTMKIGSISKTGWFDIMDWTFGTLAVTVLCLLFAIFSGWSFKTSELVDEIAIGSPSFKKKLFFGLSAGNIWAFFIRYVCPIVIGLVLLNLFGVFGAPETGG